MKPPIVICTGPMRTGSTWSFNVCRLLMKAVALQRREPLEVVYLLEHQLEEFIEKRSATVAGPTVIKTHTVGQRALDFIQTGQARAVCTIRDPRDCVVSIRTFVGREINETAQAFAAAFDLVRSYQMSPHTLFVRYEEMMQDSLLQIRRIATHLGMTPSERFLRKVDKQTNLESCRKLCDELKRRPAQQVFYSGKHRVDPVTQLHDNHIWSAECGRWRRELTGEQARSLTHLFQPLLLLLGYETADSIAGLEDVWRSVSIGLPEHDFSFDGSSSQGPFPQTGAGRTQM